MVSYIILIHLDTEDFTAVQGILEFGPEDTLPILINVSMDGIFEDEDSFTITLSVPVNETGVILGQATSTVTIFDSDCKFSCIMPSQLHHTYLWISCLES